jgi:hypothetical protein
VWWWSRMKPICWRPRSTCSSIPRRTSTSSRKPWICRAVGFGGGDKIVGHESPAKWNVDPMRFLTVA